MKMKEKNDLFKKFRLPEKSFFNKCSSIDSKEKCETKV